MKNSPLSGSNEFQLLSKLSDAEALHSTNVLVLILIWCALGPLFYLQSNVAGVIIGAAYSLTAYACTRIRIAQLRGKIERSKYTAKNVK